MSLSLPSSHIPAGIVRKRPVTLAGIGLVASLAALQLPEAGAQTHGRWIGAGSNTAVFSDPANWENGTVAGGSGATANFVYDPYSDNGGGGNLAGGLIFDMSVTLGTLIFEDIAGFGGSTIGFNNPAVPAVLTLEMPGTGTPPVLMGGQVLNSQNAGKKIVINAGLAGTQGLLKNGPGYLSVRGATAANTISGNLIVESGVFSVRQQYPSVTGVTARNGGSFELDNGGAGVNSTDRLPGLPLLTLGGAGGGGVIYNSAAAAPTAHAQSFSGVTLEGGANEIRAVIGGTSPNFQDMTWNLGAIAPGTASTLNLARSAGTGTGNFLLTNTNGPGGIIGAWLTMNGGDWAAGAGGLAAAFNGYTANTWSAGLHTNVTSWATLDNAVTGSLRLNTANPVQLRLSGTNVIGTGGLICAQAAPVLTGGTLTTGDANGNLFLHVGAGGPTGLVIRSTIADGTGGPLRLTKALFGMVTLGADNTYTGGTTVGGGTMVLGTGFGGSTTGSVTGSIVLNAPSVSPGTSTPNGALAFNRSGTYTVPNGINPLVNGGGFIEQWSTGNLVLNQPAKVGGLRAYAGTVTLDHTAAGAPDSHLIDGTQTAGGVSLATGRLVARTGGVTVLGRAGASTVESFALTDSTGASPLTLQAGAGGTVAFNLGTVNRPVNSADGGGVLLLQTGTGGTFSTTDPGLNDFNAVLSRNGIPYVVVNGSDWGAVDSGGKILPGAQLPGFYAPLSTAAQDSNADFDTATSLASDTSWTSLRFNTAGTLETAGNLQPGGILVTPAAGGEAVISGTGFLRAPTGNGTASATTARDLPVVQNNTAARLRIEIPVVNYDASNRTELTKAGPGELELTGISTYTGRTFTGGGILRLSGTASAGTADSRTGSLLIRGGEVVVQDTAQFYTGAYFSAGQRVGEEGTLTLKDNAVFDIAADFNIGDVNAKGVLNLEGGATVITRSFFIGKSGFSHGTINQTGGTLTEGNTSAGEWFLGGNGAGDPLAEGIYNLSGGTFNPGPRNFQIGRYGTGIMNQSGGTVQANGWNALGRFTGGVGTLNLSGGTFTSTGQTFFIVGEQGHGILNVSGDGQLTARNLSLSHNGGAGTVNQTGGTVETTDVAAVSATVPGGIVFGQAVNPGLVIPEYSATYALRGGVLKTYGMGENTGITLPIRSEFRFDGGTLQATAGNSQFIQGIDAVYVEDGGAVVDSAGFEVTVAVPLEHDPALGAAPDGGLSKTGEGMLTLLMPNTYTGDTRVAEGTLVLMEPSLADGADVRLTDGGVLNLLFSGADKVDQLYLNGAAQVAGTWGSLTSSAANKTAVITGEGVLQVTSGPSTAAGYAAWAALPANGLTAGVNDGKMQDPDGDGVVNLLEYILDGNPSAGAAEAVLPVLTVNETDFAASFRRRDESEADATLVVQYSTNLTAWTDVVIGPAGNGVLSVTENGPAADGILLTIPRNGAQRLFVRLRGTPVP